jgi:hypothetical protein
MTSLEIAERRSPVNRNGLLRPFVVVAGAHLNRTLRQRDALATEPPVRDPPLWHSRARRNELRVVIDVRESDARGTGRRSNNAYFEFISAGRASR